MRERVAAVWETANANKARAGGIAAAAVVLVVVIGLIVWLVARGGEAVDETAYEPVVVELNDVPANGFVGWEQLSASGRPELSSTPEGVSADVDECVPGGDRQRQVEKLIVDGDRWASTQFIQAAWAQTMAVSIANTGHKDVSVLDQWLVDCAETTITVDGQEQTVVLGSLPIEAEFYRLDTARVWAQMHTDHEGRTTTSLFAYGQSGDEALQVQYTYPGTVTDAAIAQLDVVWRAQAAKLVGAQEADQI